MSLRSLVPLVVFTLAAACAKQAPPPTEPGAADPAASSATQAPPDPAQAEPAPVVDNVDAQPGDTTTCPFSGRTFVVKAEHPRVEYEGKLYWICSEKAAESVRADPAKYLADFDG